MLLQSKKPWIAAGLLAAASSCAFIVFGERGLLELHRLNDEKAALERANGELRERNRALEREIKALKDDPAAVERLARERLGMVKDGEVVYYLTREGPKALAPAATRPAPAPAEAP